MTGISGGESGSCEAGRGSGGAGSGSSGAGSISSSSDTSCHLPPATIRKINGSNHDSERSGNGDGGDSADGRSVEGQEREGKLPAVVHRGRGYVVTFSKKPRRDMTISQGESGVSIEDPEMEEINIKARLQCQTPAQVRADQKKSYIELDV